MMTSIQNPDYERNVDESLGLLSGEFKKEIPQQKGKVIIV